MPNAFLYIKTVLFQTIQFGISTKFSSIPPIDRTLSGATSPGQSGPGSDGNRVIRILQSSSTTGVSPSDCFVSNPGHSFGALCNWCNWFSLSVKLDREKVLAHIRRERVICISYRLLREKKIVKPTWFLQRKEQHNFYSHGNSAIFTAKGTIFLPQREQGDFYSERNSTIFTAKGAGRFLKRRDQQDFYCEENGTVFTAKGAGRFLKRRDQQDFYCEENRTVFTAKGLR